MDPKQCEKNGKCVNLRSSSCDEMVAVVLSQSAAVPAPAQ